jgi:hypothetical protein
LTAHAESGVDPSTGMIVSPTDEPHQSRKSDLARLAENSSQTGNSDSRGVEDGTRTTNRKAVVLGSLPTASGEVKEWQSDDPADPLINRRLGRSRWGGKFRLRLLSGAFRSVTRAVQVSLGIGMLVVVDVVVRRTVAQIIAARSCCHFREKADPDQE